MLSDFELDLPLAARAFTFAEAEEDFGQSLAVCPTPPQKRHRLLAKRRVRSGRVSFPSLPNLSPKSDCFRSELFDDEAESHGVNGFLPFLFGLLECEEEGLAADFSGFLLEG